MTASVKLFWQDPYMVETDAEVTSVDGDKITLDRTIVYAFSGGQQSDSGIIGGFEIKDAKKEGLDIVYTLPSGHRLNVGDRVKVSIDWAKRYRIMRLHFAAELILELVYQNFGHPEKIGANITEEKARVDFYWNGNISAIFPVLKEKTDFLIASDLEIISGFSDEAAERRYWEIRDFARVSCGGTHLKRTGEIGPLQLKRGNLGGGKERIEIYLTS